MLKTAVPNKASSLYMGGGIPTGQKILKSSSPHPPFTTQIHIYMQMNKIVLSCENVGGIYM